MSQADNKAGRPKKGLGRGLDALLGEALRDDSNSNAKPGSNSDSMAAKAANVVSENVATSSSSGVSLISVASIEPNPDQPRRYFAEEALEELANSIERHGLVQPIVLRPYNKGYQIVAGERRWRAAQKARIHQVPALVRDYSDEETLEIALIENIQRKDLNAIEEAVAYKKLCDEFGHSQSELGKIVKKSRSHVANMMRLLDLSVPLRDLVVEEKLSMGHARALLGAEDAVPLAALVVKKGLSVRQTEALVKKSKKAESGVEGVKNITSSITPISNDADIRAVENHLGDLLGLKVSIKTRKNGKAGAVTFDYNSLDQLDMLCQRLTGESF